MDTLKTSKEISLAMKGSNDPNFKRIHHYDHHIMLHIKDCIMKESCKSYFEIGTHFGHSLCTLLQSQYKSTFISCDLFRVGKGIAKDCKIKNVEKLANDNATLFNKNNYSFKILKANSNSPKTKQKIQELLPQGIDLFFIDGNHNYKPVRKDFNLYFPLVNSGGYIVFDDYHPLTTNKGSKRGCPIAINDITKQYADKLEVIGEARELYDSDNAAFIVKKI